MDGPVFLALLWLLVILHGRLSHLVLPVVEIGRQRAVRLVVLHKALMERFRLSRVEGAEVRVRRIPGRWLGQVRRKAWIPVRRQAERIRVRSRRTCRRLRVS